MKVCTKPTSCEFDIKSATYSQMAQSRAEHLSTPKKEFDLKSVTNSQMAKSRAEHLSPPKKKGPDSQLTYFEIWDTLLGWPNCGVDGRSN